MWRRRSVPTRRPAALLQALVCSRCVFQQFKPGSGKEWTRLASVQVSSLHANPTNIGRDQYQQENDKARTGSVRATHGRWWKARIGERTISTGTSYVDYDDRTGRFIPTRNLTKKSTPCVNGQRRRPFFSSLFIFFQISFSAVLWLNIHHFMTQH